MAGENSTTEPTMLERIYPSVTGRYIDVQEDIRVFHKTDHDGDRTHNLPIRSRTPYPLGHAADARMEILLSHVQHDEIYDL